MKQLTFSQVLSFQNNGEEAYFIPNVKEREKSIFLEKQIELSSIPAENFTALSEYEEDDCLDDAEIIYGLIRAYRKNANVPPIILKKDLKVIDGFHRLSAMHYIGMNTIKVFLEV